jgi:hypothetical protein
MRGFRFGKSGSHLLIFILLAALLSEFCVKSRLHFFGMAAGESLSPGHSQQYSIIGTYGERPLPFIQRRDFALFAVKL